INAGSRSIQAAQQIHQGGFARAGWSHDGYILTPCNFQGDLAQGVDGLCSHLIATGDLVQADEAHAGFFSFLASPLACPFLIRLPSSKSRLMALYPPETISWPSVPPSMISI